MKKRLAWWSVGAAVLLSPAHLAAAPMGPTTQKLLVLQPDADLNDDLVAKRVTNAIRAQIFGSEEFTTTEFDLTFALLRAQEKQDCAASKLREGLNAGSDMSVSEACLKQISKRIGAERFLWGHVYRSAAEGSAPVVKMHYRRAGEPDRWLELTYHPDTVGRMAERFYRRLVIPEKTAEVRLESPKPVDGDLFVDGLQRGPFEPHLVMSLFPGEHAIEVRQDGKVVAATKVTIALAPERVRPVTLALADSATGPIPPPTQPPPGEVPALPAGGSRRATLGWVALGVGAASLGAGVFSSLRVKSISDDLSSGAPYVAYREGTSEGDLCDAAKAGFVSPRAGAAAPGQVRSRCNQMSTFRALQYAFYGVGAVAAGAGAYLLLTAPHGASSRARSAKTSGLQWQWSPEVDAQRWGLAVMGRF